MTETITYKGYKINIDTHDDAESPREERESPFTMACYHRRYDLGDSNAPSQEELADILKSDDYIYLPLYLYDHSGISISTGDFNDRFDSGQIGIIYISKVNAVTEWDKISIEDVKSHMRAEVETYDQYLRGDIYEYEVIAPDGYWIDSCCGFYGYDNEASGLLECARDSIDCHMTAKYLKRNNTLKTLIKNKVPLNKRLEILL